MQANTLSTNRNAIKGRRFRRTRFPVPCYFEAALYGKLRRLKLEGRQTWRELFRELIEHGERCRARRARLGKPPKYGTARVAGDPPKARKPLSESIPDAGAGAVL